MRGPEHSPGGRSPGAPHRGDCAPLAAKRQSARARTTPARSPARFYAGGPGDCKSPGGVQGRSPCKENSSQAPTAGEPGGGAPRKDIPAGPSAGRGGGVPAESDPAQAAGRPGALRAMLIGAALVLAAGLALCALSVPARAQVGGGFELTWWTVDGGGVTWLEEGTFTLGGTIGQPDAGPNVGGDFALVQSGFWHDDGGVTAVKLVRLAAFPERSHIVVAWETASEHDNAGFNLYRSAAPDTAGARLNDLLIPSESPGGGAGAAYAFRDETAAAGLRYYYTLEAVDTAGRPARFGPAAAGRWGAYLPVVGR